jgi:hypothetical protein
VTRTSRSVLASALSLSLSLAACSSAAKPPADHTTDPTASGAAGDLSDLTEHRAAAANPSLAYRWVDITLEVTGREVDKVGARPTIISRQMAIPMTAMYDAWAAYDDRAVGTRLGGALRRPVAERTRANKEIAISYAVYRALVDIFPEDRAWLTDQMRALGHDPGDTSTDPRTPAGVGNAAAAAVLEYRRDDGANQRGDRQGSIGGPYSDYSGYKPVNPIDHVIDPDRWQPLPFSDGNGGVHHPGFLTPHWYLVKPFALERSDQFRPPPYPKDGSPEILADVDECIDLNGNLTLERKAIVEFMRDGPRSTGQSGHWLLFAQDVSRRDRHGLDEDVKIFFSIANVSFDAFIASWEAKRYYDSSRPWTLIRHYRKGASVLGYLGECRGFGTISAEEWMPYSPPTFITPPFPGYPSGHSTVSAASARMLEHFTGSDELGAFARHRAGIYTEADCAPAKMQARDGKPPAGPGLSAEVILRLPTFSATAEMAGISRIMGGYHIQADNTAGLTLGRNIADYSWPKYQAYFDGTAKVVEQPVRSTAR